MKSIQEQMDGESTQQQHSKQREQMREQKNKSIDETVQQEPLAQ